MVDRLMSPYDPPAHGVAFGNRRYRTQVILAAALHQAGMTAKAYRAGAAAGLRELRQFKAMSRPEPDAS